MKRLLMIVILLIAISNGNSQLPVSGDTAILAAIQSLNEISNEVQGEIKNVASKELLSKGAGFLQTYQSLETIYDLLQDFICNIHEMNLYMNALNRKGDCLFDLKYNMSVANLSLSTDILKFAVLGKNLTKMGNQMDAGSRNLVLQGIVDALRATMNDMNNLRGEMRMDWESMILREYNKNRQLEMAEVNKAGLKFNRYHR